MYGWVERNPALFMQLIRKLSPLDQDLLLSYFVLGRTQTSLGQLFNYTQTEVSTFLRLACKRLTFFVLFGEVSAAKIAPVLEAAGLNHPYDDNNVTLSAVVEAYAQCRSYQQVANQFAIRKPDVRRSMSQASTTLLDRPSPAEESLGAVLYGFTHRLGAGRSRSILERRDPAVLGEFRINVRDRDFDHLFQPRADI
jgi:hypothetical protein